MKKRENYRCGNIGKVASSNATAFDLLVLSDVFFE